VGLNARDGSDEGMKYGWRILNTFSYVLYCISIVEEYSIFSGLI
jgi:hypothetical protein